MCEKVREMRADIGIALDGDADRVLIADEQGNLVDGDQLMAVIARSWKRDGAAARRRPRRHHHVQSRSRALSGARKLALARTKVGDRYVVEQMRKNGFNIGGEQSGHIVLSDFSTTGDGLIAALQVLAEVVRTGKPVSEVCHVFEPVPQVLKNVKTGDGKPLENNHVKQAIAEAVERLGQSGRLVIRPSGTEPLIRVMAEGDDAGLVTRIVEDICQVIAKAA